jgi:tRNA (cytidine32/guanosine34-2'-O)-methyltransferase
VDLFQIADIEGVTSIKGDITRAKTVEEITEVFENNDADLVLSDGAPDVLGDHDFDQFVQHQLVLAALNVALRTLAVNGTFIAKIFRGKDIHLLLKQINSLFKECYCAKPKCSRNSSIESFVVAKGFIGRSNV